MRRAMVLPPPTNRFYLRTPNDPPHPVGMATVRIGMIATGNHRIRRFAALCNTPAILRTPSAPLIGVSEAQSR